MRRSARPTSAGRQTGGRRTAPVRHPRLRPRRRPSADDSAGPRRLTSTTIGDAWLDDAERDEDADGLTNFDETRGFMPGLLGHRVRRGDEVLRRRRRDATRRPRTRTATASATAPTTRTTTTSRTSWSAAASSRPAGVRRRLDDDPATRRRPDGAPGGRLRRPVQPVPAARRVAHLPAHVSTARGVGPVQPEDDKYYLIKD